MGSRSIWRARAPILAALGAALAVDAAVILFYRSFYDVRVRSLQAERRELERRRDEGKEAVEKLKGTERRLAGLEEGLRHFYGKTLGPRKERLAPLIDEIHEITKKAGLRPDSISYAEQALPDADSISMRFSVAGSYAEIKRLIAVFESSPRFLILESIAVSVDEGEADLLKVSFTLSHYFRGENSPFGSQEEEPAAASKPGAAVERPGKAAAVLPAAPAAPAAAAKEAGRREPDAVRPARETHPNLAVREARAPAGDPPKKKARRR